MAPKRPDANAKAPSRQRQAAPPSGRLALGAYLKDPAAWPASVVIFHTDDVVALRDRFAKASVHALLLPRRPRDVCLRHPLDALSEDGPLLARLRGEVGRLRGFVAAELQRRFGPESRADAARQAVLDGVGSSVGALPAGRDWAAEVRCGVHAAPSMSHLHIHVLSRDLHSSSLRHRKHYNSFTTPFFVSLDDFPLAADDPRRDPGGMGYLGRDLVCWRCGMEFGNQFKRLKEHLEGEFEAWRRE